MIKDIGTIWHTLAACEPVDSVKFGEFCAAFVEKYEADSNINFYQFSPTMHKILGSIALLWHKQFPAGSEIDTFDF